MKPSKSTTVMVVSACIFTVVLLLFLSLEDGTIFKDRATGLFFSSVTILAVAVGFAFAWLYRKGNESKWGAPPPQREPLVKSNPVSAPPPSK
jgi:hypothetical protein